MNTQNECNQAWPVQWATSPSRIDHNLDVRTISPGSGQRKWGSGQVWVAAAGPFGVDYKAAGVQEEPWWTWLSRRRRVGMGGGAGGVGVLG